jgi:hypothetical protein
MFQLTSKEFDALRFQIGTSKGRGGRRTPPYAFTEQGVAMLSSVLHTDRAADVNLAIIRTFVKLREVLATHKDLARKVEQHDHQIAILFDRVQKLLAPPNPPKHPIGYILPQKTDAPTLAHVKPTQGPTTSNILTNQSPVRPVIK